MRKALIIMCIPLSCLSQEINIVQLDANINTYEAEINFIQINDSTAFFTVINNENDWSESSIYSCRLVENEWKNKQYSKYNSEIVNTANINFSKSEKVVFSICDKKMKECKIGLLDEKKSKEYKEIPLDYNSEVLYTQAHISRHNSQEVMYFVSDREGGFGGLDIWVSIIDKEGNFGVPINAGNKINSPSDEITPFFNNYDESMYFSSNKKNGVGGFDIYKSQGKLNLWEPPTNVVELNTKQDEMYLTFYSDNSGYFASNRKGAKFKSTEYCCNDIFSFKYSEIEKETIPILSKIKKYLPLELYFHNDEPDCCTMSDTTSKTYKDAYISYFQMKDEYEYQNPSLNNFFDEELQGNYNQLNIIFEMLLEDLNKGIKMELQIRGYASPLHKPKYNHNLSQRRIVSLINYLMQFKGGILKRHIFSQNLMITELPFGESASPGNISDDPYEKKKSIYSIDAMRERKIQIIDVILKD